MSITTLSLYLALLFPGTLQSTALAGENARPPLVIGEFCMVNGSLTTNLDVGDERAHADYREYRKQWEKALRRSRTAVAAISQMERYGYTTVDFSVTESQSAGQGRAVTYHVLFRRK